MQSYKLQHLTGKKLKTFLAVADRIIPADADSPGGGSCPNADEPRASASPAAALNFHARLLNRIMASLPPCECRPIAEY